MDEDARREFLAESRENLDRVDSLLLELEKDPSAIAHVAPIFRAIHTIKGTCGFLGFGKLEALTHAGENLLSRAREGLLAIDAQVMTALFALIDAVRGMLASIEEHGHDGTADHAVLIDALKTLQHKKPEAAAVLELGTSGPPVSSPAGLEVSDIAAELGRGADTFVRVDLRVLDHLMNLVGELVLVRNQLLQIASQHEGVVVTSTAQRLNLITSELQSGVLKTRMQPIRNLWGKFPRLVRDLAVQCGKEVELDLDGEATELDRTLLEAIKDPLVHLVRNAVSHGIEPAEKRVAQGKPRSGRIRMRAFHQGGRVHIEIADDGAGIHVAKLRARALQLGVISAQEDQRMDVASAANLVFTPGLSTADTVTNVSGRGVGMDVVRTNIEKAGGTIDIATEPGRGTTFHMTIPLTLTIVPALIVSAGGDRYAIPQNNLLEVLRLGDRNERDPIEQVHGAAVYRLRGRLLPIIYMASELRSNVGGERESENALPQRETGSYIVVLQAQHRTFGLVVSRVHEVVEVVVKPLGKELGEVPCFAGATILGDGQVALVVDVPSFARRAHVTTSDEEGAQPSASVKRSAAPHPDAPALVLLAGPADERMALPLALVARFEELPASEVERMGSQDEVLQYRGEILPLLRLSGLLAERRGRPRTPAGAQPPVASDALQVVVCTHLGMRVGLVVHRIVDISEELLTVQRPATRPGVLFSAVIRSRVTELLDLPWLLSAAGTRVDVQPDDHSGVQVSP